MKSLQIYHQLVGDCVITVTPRGAKWNYKTGCKQTEAEGFPVLSFDLRFAFFFLKLNYNRGALSISAVDKNTRLLYNVVLKKCSFLESRLNKKRKKKEAARCVIFV